MRAFLLFALLCPVLAQAAGRIFTVEYPPSTHEGESIYGVTYRLWIPDGVKQIRAVIVHQHGCGAGACKGGETAADDLHWQALAKKWDAALLGPSYHQAEGQDCRKWYDPRNGSETTFLRALSDLAKQTGHAEVERAPWCLWGHSGGGFWSSFMLTMHPERCAAVWLRSGSYAMALGKNEIPKPILTDETCQVPVMGNPGSEEKGDKLFHVAWEGTLTTFLEYRAKGALIGFAPDPLTSHEAGDSRYLAIPFFDACLAMRLPDKGGDISKLKSVDVSKVWLAPLAGDTALPESKFTGDKNTAVWLPNEAIAKAWMEYVKTGGVSDTTPPPAPMKLAAKSTADGIELTWDAEADFESGLQQFLIEADGKEIARVPEKLVPRFGRPLFQGKTYGDTAEVPLAEMRIVIKNPPQGAKPPVFTVRSINSVGLRSEASAEARP